MRFLSILIIPAVGSQLMAERLDYATYFGGTSPLQQIHAVETSDSCIVIGGLGGGLDFPVTPGTLLLNNARTQLFLAKIDPSREGRAALIYSGFVAGAVTSIQSMRVGPGDHIYIVGDTGPTDLLTTPGAIQAEHAAPGFGRSRDVFINVVAVRGDGTASIVYARYFGGPGDDKLRGSVVADDGRVALWGTTGSQMFPVTPGSYRSEPNTLRGTSSNWVAVIDPSKTG